MGPCLSFGGNQRGVQKVDVGSKLFCNRETNVLLATDFNISPRPASKNAYQGDRTSEFSVP